MDRTLPPVALLHGWGGSFASTFAATGWADALAEAGRVVIAVDLPGHGGPASADPAAYADLASDLDARLPAGPIDLIGFSLGGKLALALAARDPARFGHIVIGGVGDNLFAPEPNGEALAVVLEQGIHADTPAPIAALARYATAGGNDPRALAAILRRPANPTLTEHDLRALSGVLIVNGSEDRIAMPDERLRGALPDPGYLALPGVDHLSLPADPRFRNAALAFIGKPRPDRSGRSPLQL